MEVVASLLLVLMDAHKVEPVMLLSTSLEKLKLPISESSEQPFISDIAHSVESKFGLSLLKQNWFNQYVIGFGSSSIVINEPRYL